MPHKRVSEKLCVFAQTGGCHAQATEGETLLPSQGCAAKSIGRILYHVIRIVSLVRVGPLSTSALNMTLDTIQAWLKDKTAAGHSPR